MANIESLNQKFGIDNKIQFYNGNGNLPFVKINNDFASAIVSLYGAHLISFIPVGEKDILWMSAESAFETGKPIRGGVPVCFPWFGPHANDSQKPQHGFARLMEWDVKSTSILQNGSTEIQLILKDSEATKALWNFSFNAIITIVVAQKTSITLTIKNIGTEAFTFTEALHSYFNISSLANINISGLENTSYYNAGSSDLQIQTTPLLLINKEENRRYINHKNDCIITDSDFNRKIIVGKSNSNVTVVWNPGEHTTKNIIDIANEGYQSFVCVEAVNAFDDIITVAPEAECSMISSFGLA